MLIICLRMSLWEGEEEKGKYGGSSAFLRTKPEENKFKILVTFSSRNCTDPYAWEQSTEILQGCTFCQVHKNPSQFGQAVEFWRTAVLSYKVEISLEHCNWKLQWFYLHWLCPSLEFSRIPSKSVAQAFWSPFQVWAPEITLRSLFLLYFLKGLLRLPHTAKQ